MNVVLGVLLLLFGIAASGPQSLRAQDSVTTMRMATLCKMAQDSGWTSMPMGALMVRFGRQLLGTPYVGGTLEGSGPEVCRVTFTGLDCVTFFESILNLSRIVKAGSNRLDEFVSAVTYTRYRSGVLGGYTSRLHYTTEWILDNIRKGVISDVTPELGGVRSFMKVDFMSTHPQFYPALKNDTASITRIAEIEKYLQKQPMSVIPREGIRAIESQLRDGDIIAIATSKKGLDYAHTGVVIREGRRARLMHASSTKRQVVLDGYIGDVVARVETWTGISVLRPVDVSR